MTKQPKTRKRYSIATEIGLRLPHSEASLKYIEEWDPDLYEEIKRVNKREKRRMRKNERKTDIERRNRLL